MKKICLTALIIFVLIFALMPTVQAQSPQQTLNQYIADLQKNPNDNALREKIIKHVQTMKLAPAIPEEARRYFVEGNALLKAAKAQKGYGLAIDAYRQCLLIAPWWAEALYNYAVALDLANQFDEAVNVLKLYITTTPGEGESRKAQDKIYEIGAKKKLAAQEREESSPQAVAAREQNKSEDWLTKIDGRRYTLEETHDGSYTSVIDVKGKVLVVGIIRRKYPYAGHPLGYEEINRGDISGSVCKISQQPPDANTLKLMGGVYAVEFVFAIGDDGSLITRRCRFNNGSERQAIYVWQK